MKTQKQAESVIVDQFGDDIDTILEHSVLDGTCPAVCMNDDCEFTAEYEPDSKEGHCDLCGTKTVTSVLEICFFGGA